MPGEIEPGEERSVLHQRSGSRNSEASRVMKIGIISPNADNGIAPAELARDLEERGYDSLWVGEHTHMPVSRDSPHPSGGEMPHVYSHVRDPFVSLGMAAAVTTRLKLGTAVCQVLQHQVLDLAKSIATLDRLSHGRFLFGAGVGWNREELANVSPVPWPRRFEAMRETIAALREIWANDVASYDGEFVKFTPSWSYPKPTRPSGPPILLGLHGPLGLRHVAAYADEWLPAASRLGDLREGFATFRAAVEAAGRDPANIPISLVCFSPPSVGKIESYASLGVQRIVLLGPNEVDPYKRFADAFQPILEQFAS